MNFALYRAEHEDVAAVAYACETVEAGETLHNFPIGADAAAKAKSTEAGAHAIAGLEQRSMKAVVVRFSSDLQRLVVFIQHGCCARAARSGTYCQLEG